MRNLTKLFIFLSLLVGMGMYINTPISAYGKPKAAAEEIEEDDDSEEIEEDNDSEEIEEEEVEEEKPSKSSKKKKNKKLKQLEDMEDSEGDDDGEMSEEEAEEFMKALMEKVESGEISEEEYQKMLAELGVDSEDLMNSPLMFVNSEERENAKEFDILSNELHSEAIHPSYILFKTMSKNMKDNPDFIVLANKGKGTMTVTIEQNELMNKSISDVDLETLEHDAYVVPINWNRKALLNADQPGFINFVATVDVDGKTKKRINKSIAFRSVNEAVLGFTIGEEYFDLKTLFACYVNEDHPMIDKVLADICARNRNASFDGYQSNNENSVKSQLENVWNYFAKKGTRYSSISDTSKASHNKVFTQYVRFFSQVINNNQANCIDGTCMLASIYRKIGLDTNIVLVPGHAFLAVNRHEDRSNPKFFVIETTMMGSQGSSFNDALNEGSKEYQENYQKHSQDGEMQVVNITEARENGIMPLGR